MRINRNPCFLSMDDEARGYRSIARFVLSWGPVELCIEGFIVWLRAQPAGDGEWEFPVSFSRKVKELKDLLKESEDLAGVRDRVRPLLAKAKSLHTMRTHVAHSHFQGQNLDGQLMFTRSDQRNGIISTDAHYSISELEAAAEKCANIHDEMQAFWPEIMSYSAAKFKRRYGDMISRPSGNAD